MRADVIDQTSMEECNGDPQKSAESDRYWSSSRGGWTCPLAEPDSGPNCSENLRLGPRLVARWMELEARIKAAEKETNGLAVPVPQQLPAVWGLGKEGDPDYDWVRRRLTPHPLQSYTTALTFKAPVGNNLPRTYIHCTQPSHPVLEDSRKLVQSWTGWKWVDLAAPHDAMITHPDDVVGLLLGA